MKEEYKTLEELQSDKCIHYYSAINTRKREQTIFFKGEIVGNSGTYSQEKYGCFECGGNRESGCKIFLNRKMLEDMAKGVDL